MILLGMFVMLAPALAIAAVSPETMGTIAILMIGEAIALAFLARRAVRAERATLPSARVVTRR